jgi:hypothetical protein
MIDALEISVPDSIMARPGVWDQFKQIKQKTGPYVWMVDCRPRTGLFVFHGHRYHIDEEHRHYKLTYEAVRQLTVDDLTRRIQFLFPLDEGQIRELKVMRIDFAVNVSPSVEWFRRHFYVKGKQESTEYAFIQKTTMEVTTLIFGKRPDRYSIYDKVKEVIDSGRELLQTGVRPGDKPRPVTRVERQCTGVAVPMPMRTLGGLFENAAKFNPFENVVLLEGKDLPDTTEWTAQRWLMNLGVKAAVRQYGWDGARKQANRRSTRNNIIDGYLDLTRPSGPALTQARLSEIYQRTTLLQLNQPVNGIYPMGGLSREV